MVAVKTGEKLRKIHFHPTLNAPLLLKAQEKSEIKNKIKNYHKYLTNWKLTHFPKNKKFLPFPQTFLNQTKTLYHAALKGVHTL